MIAEIEQTNDWLDRLEAIEHELALAEAGLADARDEDVPVMFERVHRLALRAAGIVREQANAQRKRPLPISVWASLRRCGRVHARRAEDVQPFVELRQRAEASPRHARDITTGNVREHISATLTHVRYIRGEIMGGEAIAA